MDIKGCFGSDSSRSQKSALYLYMPGLSLDVAGQRTFEVVLTVAVGGWDNWSSCSTSASSTQNDNTGGAMIESSLLSVYSVYGF
ncbi:hypothetical protein CJU75_02235 [Pseudomonas fragi]|nr:hypothetical protein CJU75_02235 [Pseudomonas fragi]